MKPMVQRLRAVVLKQLSVQMQVIFTQTNVIGCSYQLSFYQTVTMYALKYIHTLSHILCHTMQLHQLQFQPCGAIPCTLGTQWIVLQ